jgi:hypothetical protein
MMLPSVFKVSAVRTEPLLLNLLSGPFVSRRDMRSKPGKLSKNKLVDDCYLELYKCRMVDEGLPAGCEHVSAKKHEMLIVARCLFRVKSFPIEITFKLVQGTKAHKNRRVRDLENGRQTFASQVT